jgi:hypothetical protein
LDNEIKQNEMGAAREVQTGYWRESLRERHHLEDTGIDGRVILKCIFKTWDRRHGLDRLGSGEGQVAGSCTRKCGNKPSGSIKFGEFLY